MATKRICVYLSQRDQGNSPAGIAAEVVYETLIMPAMDRLPDFAMNPRGYIHESQTLSDQLVKEMLEADLVIADLTELSPSGYYELGVRHAAQLPMVLIADTEHVLAINAPNFQLLRYPFSISPSTAGDTDTVDRLVAAIEEALELRPSGSGSPVSLKKSLQERRYELAERLVETAEVIRLLRLNSAGDAITEMLAIADELKVVDDAETPSALKEAADKALKVLFRIMDQLATVRGSRVAISGAIAMIIGGSGWPAVTALGLGLAFWEGKDAFLKAIAMMGSKKR